LDIKNKKVLILGGWGLVGSAIARQIVAREPSAIVLTSLKEIEAKEICDALTKEFGKEEGYFVPCWGNIFIRNKYKDTLRSEYVEDPVKRLEVLGDIVDELTDDILKESALYHMFEEHKPDVVVDCINTATGIAYADIYKSYNDILGILKKGDGNYEELKSSVEKLIGISYVPQLIRHIQILYNSMNAFGTKFYLKIGTSGTGGMGLNIPFTHSEEKPSRVLLSKASVAGAHTLLLFLMARTPGGPIVKELKPTASIAWKKIAYGEVPNKGMPMKLYDVSMDQSEELGSTFIRKTDKEYKENGNLKTAFIDTGENGIFARGEFETITSVGQMEFITPEEIAEAAIDEIRGSNTGHDIVNALDASVMEPTYRAGFMQSYAVEKLDELEKQHNTSSVAFEMLGPPRLTKLLYEAEIIRLIYKNFNNYINSDPGSRSQQISDFLKENFKLRNEIVSVGLPILMEDGKTVLRGPEVLIPSKSEGNEIEITPEQIDKWTHSGWVDIRKENWDKWESRLRDIMAQTKNGEDNLHSSRFIYNDDYWEHFENINIGKVVGWLFINEEDGLRFKR
jgi:hypothetical protein